MENYLDLNGIVKYLNGHTYLTDDMARCVYSGRDGNSYHTAIVNSLREIEGVDVFTYHYDVYTHVYAKLGKISASDMYRVISDDYYQQYDVKKVHDCIFIFDFSIDEIESNFGGAVFLDEWDEKEIDYSKLDEQISLSNKEKLIKLSKEYFDFA